MMKPALDDRPKVGVGVMVYRNTPKGIEILLGKRLNSHGCNTFACPGGHLEYGESIATCAQREVLEETGLEVGLQDVEFVRVANILFQEGKHYIDVGVSIEYQGSQAPQVMEPHKCEEWNWYALADLPEQKFPLLESIIEAFESRSSVSPKIFFEMVE